jgi:hypothetical protein
MRKTRSMQTRVKNLAQAASQREWMTARLWLKKQLLQGSLAGA